MKLLAFYDAVHALPTHVAPLATGITNRVAGAGAIAGEVAWAATVIAHILLAVSLRTLSERACHT